MAIPAQRFVYLDDTTNLPTGDFVNNTASTLQNSPQNALKLIGKELKSLVDGSKGVSASKILSNLTGTNGVVSRLTKDFFSSNADISGLDKNQLTSLANNLFGNNKSALSIFNGQLGEKCKQAILGSTSPVHNPKTTAVYNGKSRTTTQRSCATDAFAALINAVSGGNYNVNLTTQSALGQLVSSVAVRGMQIGLPDVFSTLTKGITDKTVLAQAGQTVMSEAASAGDFEAIKDIANSSAAPYLAATNSNVCSQALSNFSIPTDTKVTDFSSLYGDLTGSMSNLDPNWNKFQLTDGTTIPSVSNMPVGNDDFNRVYASVAISTVPITSDVTSGTVTAAQWDTHAYTALQSASEMSTQDQIKAEFGDLPLGSLDGDDNQTVYEEV